MLQAAKMSKRLFRTRKMLFMSLCRQSNCVFLDYRSQVCRKRNILSHVMIHDTCINTCSLALVTGCVDLYGG